MGKYEVEVSRIGRPRMRVAAGLVGLSGLRAKINRNMNVREVAEEIDAQGNRIPRGSIAGVIGGPPSQRGVGGVVVRPPVIPPPVVPPGSLPPPTTEPPAVPPPASVAPATWEDLSVGGGIPIYLTHEVAINSVLGAVSDRLDGPLLVRGWELDTFGGESTSAQWNLIRVDFSPNPDVQTFTFNDNGLPTGGQPDGISLYAHGVIHDATTLAGSILTQGWFRLLGTVNAFMQISPPFSSLVVPYSQVFVKFYSQNDTAGLRIHSLWLDAVRLRSDLVPESPLIVPRETVQQLTRSEFRALQNLRRPAKNP